MPFKDEADWELTYYTFGDGEYLGSQSWDELLAHKRSVILAGAGAGKTAEMRERAQIINAEGVRDAFYFPLNTLAEQNLNETLQTMNDADRFSVWLSSDGEAVFFADSLDEARLNGNTFNEALASLKSGLGKHAHRATILVSCRISDWEDFQDLGEFASFLSEGDDTAKKSEDEVITDPDEALLAPLFKDDQPENDASVESAIEEDGKPLHEKINVVALAPLTRRQAKQIAEGTGIENVDRFFEQISISGAADLATRPLDLLELAHYWDQHGVISTKLEAMQWSLELRLNEPTDAKRRTDTLSHKRVFVGVKLIAAAMTFGHKRFISWPFEGYKAGPDKVSLEPSKVLRDWSPADQRILMGRAVFDPASNGRVRFHNREVQEYLTAEWLLDQITAGCSINRVWHLLSQRKYGKVRIRPSLRPIAAWLAQKNERIRTKIFEVAPEVLVEYGDPGALPLPVKEQFLSRFATSYSGRNDAGISIDIQQLRWLAEAKLAPKIKELWHQSSNSGVTQELLMRLTWIGEIAECADIALEAACQIKHHYKTSLGARALAEVGDDSDRKKLLAYVIMHRRKYPSRAIEPALRAIVPVLASADFLKIIKDYPTSSERVFHTGIEYALGEVFRDRGCTEPDLIIPEIWKLLKKKPLNGREQHGSSTKYRHLKAPLLDIIAWCLKQMQQAPLSDCMGLIVRSVALMTRHSSSYSVDESHKRFLEALHANAGANRQQFNLSVEHALKEGFGAWIFANGQGFSETWKLENRDFGWLLEDLSTEFASARRDCILNGAFGVYKRDGQPAEKLKQIHEAIADCTIQMKALDELIDPPPVEPKQWEKDHDRIMDKNRHKWAVRTEKNKDSWRIFRSELQQEPNRLTTRLKFGQTYDLYRWLHRKCGFEIEEYCDWHQLEPAFGSEVALAARNALVAYWRTYDPTGLFRKSKNTNGLEVGRLGLEIEAQEKSDWVKKLDSDSVRIATAYLLHDLNSVSRTACALWTERAAEVQKFVCHEFTAEFQRKPKDNRVQLIERFKRAPEPLRSIVASWLLGLLKKKQPICERRLADVLTVIAHAQVIDKIALLEIAKSRFRKSRKQSHRVRWLAIWLGIDAESAIGALEKWLSSKKTLAEKDAVIITLLAFMFEDRHYKLGSQLQDFRQLDSLTKLVALAYQHIRWKEDNQHEGSYTPDQRDYAEDARSTLLGMLLDIPGEGTVDALLHLRNEPEFDWSRERFEVLADERAAKDSDLEPWSPQDVLEFMQTHETTPKNVTELFTVLEDRFDDIRDEIENGQFSNKAEIRQDHVDWPKHKHDERVIQLAIARELNQRRADVYSNVREEEQEDRNEPDISVYRLGLPHHIPVEIKVSDSWSYNELEDTISDQIIGKYLKPAAATHGFLVMTYHGRKTYWQEGKGQPRLDFKGLIKALRSAAVKTCAEFDSVDFIGIIGIDLSA